ncbi:MAG: hypothetical protein M3310_04300 [Actinomycetota bacterium]|nr:hypothetical protein [Actinomycetota bacterium]
MEKQRVECLSCGALRNVRGTRPRRVDAGECPRCGYVGWARVSELTDAGRRMLREHPVERRRLRIV